MTPPLQSRPLPPGLAPVVQELELRQARLIGLADLELIRERSGIRTPAKVLAARLRRYGWLLPTARRGVYEFAPGAHAGAFSRGDVTLALQAVLYERPGLAAGLTFQSAAWALGAADRAPSRLEVAAGDKQTRDFLARTLRGEARIKLFAPQLPWLERGGVPVLGPASLWVHLATRPSDVRSWSSTVEWLPEIAADVRADQLRGELAGRPTSVAVRAAYLLSGLRPDLAEHLADAATSNKTWFGARGPLLRHDYRWQVADTLLPFDPRTLPEVTPSQDDVTVEARTLRSPKAR